MGLIVFLFMLLLLFGGSGFIISGAMVGGILSLIAVIVSVIVFVGVFCGRL